MKDQITIIGAILQTVAYILYGAFIIACMAPIRMLIYLGYGK